MANGQRPTEGRITRRRSPGSSTRTLGRLYPLTTTTPGAEQYGVNSTNTATLALEYFWGVTAAGSVTGTIAATEDGDVSAIVAGHGPNGTIAATEANDTSTIVAGHGPSGSIAVTEANDVSTITAGHGPSGTIVVTEVNDTSTIVAGYGPSGTIAGTEANDVMTSPASSGQVVWFNGQQVSVALGADLVSLSVGS